MRALGGLRLVTFNVYWLMGSGFADYRPGPPREDVLAGVGRLIGELDAGIACVQELQSRDAAAALARASGMASWCYQPGACPSRPQYGGATFARDDGWDFLPVADRRIERFAIRAVRRSDGLCVANVHLRSDRFEPHSDAGAARCDELSAILDATPAPQVVAGDFNARPDAALWDVLRSRGYRDAAERMGAGDAPTTLGSARIDRVWVSAEPADRLASVEVIGKGRTAMPSGEHLSDHLPVVAEFAP